MIWLLIAWPLIGLIRLFYSYKKFKSRNSKDEISLDLASIFWAMIWPFYEDL